MFFIFVDWPLQVLAAKVPFFEPILYHSVFKLIYDIINVHTLESSEVVTLVGVPIVTFLAFGALGSFIFQRKEIK